MLSDRVLFIDAEAIVLDKPSGLPLDRDTSGCLLLSRNPKTHRRFQRAFEEGRVRKRYIAVVDGIPERDSGMIDLALVKVSSATRGWRMTGAANGKPSRTHWKVLDVKDRRALVEFVPETGRTHQIRVHAAEGLGTPVSGDPVYGGGHGPFLLHADSLMVPRDGKPPIDAAAPFPERFREGGFDG